MTDPGVEAVRAARAELDAVIDEIRQVDGFESFLAPPSFDDIAGAADSAPLVYFAAADQGGLALIVRGKGVDHVPLDSLTADELRVRAEAYLEAYTEYGRDPAGRSVGWSRALSATTRWLWTAAVAPVLARLSGTSEVVFVAGGLLGLLPMHAAWTDDPSTPTGRRYVLDEITISYAPNARALQAARGLAAEVTGRRLLSVVDPAPVPARPLPFAHVEARGFAAGANLEGERLVGVRATPLRFGELAPRCDIMHLACHGWADLDEPLQSGLLMATGRRVVLRQLMEMRMRVRLAVLSACETALPGTELPDEVIGLPTGLLQAGVAGVVASQWAVPDGPTAMLMTEFARRWAGGEVAPPLALRQAQRWLRDTTNHEKREHWRHRDPPLPADVVEEFVDAVRFGEPGDRDHAGIRMWAAFTHLGA